MTRFSSLPAALLTVAVVLFPAGCSEKPKVADAPTAKKDGLADGENARSAEYLQNVHKVSAVDREAALRQQVCAVAGKPLGSMGVPVKVVLKERSIFLCCKGCESKVKSDPDKVLRRVDELTSGGHEHKDGGKDHKH